MTLPEGGVLRTFCDGVDAEGGKGMFGLHVGTQDP